MLSHAAEQDACFLHENGRYSCPSPTNEGGDDLENMAASPPLQVWFDTEVLEALESDNLDVVAATEQHSKTAFRSDVQIEPSEEIPNISESLTSIDAQKVESEFAARNVTELIVDDGRQAERSDDAVERCRWIDPVCETSRKERLLRNTRSFGELWHQRGECAIPCNKQL